jgi:hypothetical protein
MRFPLQHGTFTVVHMYCTFIRIILQENIDSAIKVFFVSPLEIGSTLFPGGQIKIKQNAEKLTVLSKYKLKITIISDFF